MSQFWQNLQERLQPAVPKESTLDPGQEVEEGLLLDRVDEETRGAAVGGQDHGVALALAHEAEAALAVAQRAVARTDVALDAIVVDGMPESPGRGHRRPGGGSAKAWTV
jgi:hypothetical protein